MFEQRRYRSTGSSAAGILELIYHATVQEIRKKHRTGGTGIILDIVQAVAMIAIFVTIMQLTGLRGSAIRGDFILYVASGVFLFRTFNKTIGAVFAADSATSSMMLHAPMNTVVSIAAAALAALYRNTVTIFVLLFLYHAAIKPIVIERPLEAYGCLLMTWGAAVTIGLMFRAAKPWAPKLVNLVKQIYMRANMITSGKMFLANTLPGAMLPFFSWNPLFHTIDQARGYVFLDYSPHFSSLTYPFYVALALLTLGMMGEFFTRQNISASWGNR